MLYEGDIDSLEKRFVNDNTEYYLPNGLSPVCVFRISTKVPEEFQRDLIRGYFDGDGSIIAGNGSPSMSFIGTYEFLSVVREKLGIISKVKKDTRTEGNTYVLTTRGTPIITRIFHYLYDDAERYLERKYNKFLKCIK